MPEAVHPTTPNRLSPMLVRLFLVLLVAAVWGRTVGHRFVWDDANFITNLPSIRSVRSIPAMFTTREAQSYPNGLFPLFRPIRTVVYCLLVQIGGGKPRAWIFHLANVAIHALNVLLLFQLLRRLFNRWTPGRGKLGSNGTCLWAGVGAAAFAVHPAVAEVVCWAKSLDDLLAAAFVLAAVSFWLDRARWAGAYTASFICTGLALYSKVSALPLVVLPFIEVVRTPRETRRDAWLRTLPFAALTAVYLFHRRAIIGATAQTTPISGSWSQTLVDMFPVVLSYTRLLAGIPPFCCDYTFMKGGLGLGSGPVLSGMFLLAVLVAGTLVALSRKETRLIGLGLAWVGLFLAPVSNIVPMMQYMAERFLYLPLIGWTTAIAAAAAVVGPRPRRWTLMLMMAVTLFWAGLAWRRSGVWQDDLTLFVTDALKHPSGTRLAKNAVVTTLKLPHMRQALESSSPDPATWPVVWRTLGELRKQFPNTGELYLGLGVAYLKNGHKKEGIAALEKAAKLIPGTPSVWVNMAQYYMDEKVLNRAGDCLRRALKSGPWDAAVRAKLMLWYQARGQPGNAARMTRWLQRHTGHGGPGPVGDS